MNNLNSKDILGTRNLSIEEINLIIDTAKTGSQGKIVANYYPRLARQTKRIFRVVPLGHPRCL